MQIAMDVTGLYRYTVATHCKVGVFRVEPAFVIQSPVGPVAWLTDTVSLLCVCYRYQDHDQKKN